jgi:hypothetical protein
MGTFSRQDPMYEFRWRVISDQIGIRQPGPAFRVFGFASSNEVYGYEAKYSGSRLICKFFGNSLAGIVPKQPAWRVRSTESETLRDYGLECSRTT